MLQNLKAKFSPFFMPFLLILAIGAAVYFFQQYQNISNPDREAKELKTKISRFMDLPSEDPTVATVTDKTKLDQTQDFFKRAENGDKILIFSAAQRAYIYRPSSGKIVDSATIVPSSSGISQ